MTPDEENARREDVLRKVEEIKVNMERKRVAREKYDAHMRENPQAAGTDYEKWDLWCPEDEEDELVASCTPQNAQLQAMERDIDTRYKRCGSRAALTMGGRATVSSADPFSGALDACTRSHLVLANAVQKAHMHGRVETLLQTTH